MDKADIMQEQTDNISRVMKILGKNSIDYYVHFSFTKMFKESNKGKKYII